MLNEGLKPTKSFWERKEGTAGTVFAAALGLAGLIGAYKALPYLITLLQNAWTALALGVGLFVVVSILLNSRFQTLVSHLFKSSMRWLTGLFIELDPVGIIRGYVDNLKVKRRNMNEQIEKLKGEIGKLSRTIAKEKDVYEKSMNKASQAHKSGDSKYKNLKTLSFNRAGRSKSVVEKFEGLEAKMNGMYEVLKKMYEYAGIMIEELEDQVHYIEIERNTIRSSYSAMRSAKNIIAGDGDDKLLFDQAMEGILDDIGDKIGKMDRFMDMSEDFINGADLDNMAFEEEGLRILEEWDTGGSDMMFLDQGQTQYVGDLKTQQPIATPIQRQPTTTNSNSNYFN